MFPKTTSKGLFVQLVLTTLICGQVVLVFSKPQQQHARNSPSSSPVSSSSNPEYSSDNKDADDVAGVAVGYKYILKTHCTPYVFLWNDA